MADVQRIDSLFTPKLMTGMINNVRGRSSLAALSQQIPVAFNGNEIFTFTMDNKISIVAESGAKTPGGVTIAKKSMVPIKVVYSARFSDEMWFSGEEAQLNILENFTEGYSKQLAEGLDLMAMHGINPSANVASEIIGTRHLDSLVTQKVTYDATKVDETLEDALFLVTGSGGKNTGIAMSPTAGRDMSKIAVNGVKQYPEFGMGGAPNSLAGMKIDINDTVSAFGKTQIYAGDFANKFKWGYAKEMPLELWRSGDPDNTERDLAGHNEILLRSETYLGWGILDENSFARVEAV